MCGGYEVPLLGFVPLMVLHLLPVSGFVCVFFHTQVLPRPWTAPVRMYVHCSRHGNISRVGSCLCPRHGPSGNSNFSAFGLFKIRFRTAETATDARKSQIGPCFSLSCT